MDTRSVYDQNFTPAQQEKIRTIFRDTAPALFDDLDKLKASIKSSEKPMSQRSFVDLGDEKTSAIIEFNAVIEALNALPVDALMIETDFQSKLTLLTKSTEALKNKLKLNGGWHALAILKHFIGTISEWVFYNTIILACAFSCGFIAGSFSGIVSANPLLVMLGACAGAGYGAVKGKEIAQWTPKISNYISSSMFALPSAYRADKANAIDQTVQQLQTRTGNTPHRS